MSGVEHSANKETIPQVVAYKRLNTMENDKAKQLIAAANERWSHMEV